MKNTNSITYSVFNKKESPDVISVTHAAISYFGNKRRVDPNENIKISRKKVIEETITIPKDILERMNAIDTKLLYAGISKFYATRRPHRRLYRKPALSFANYNFAMKLDSAENIYNIKELEIFYDAKNLRNIIHKNNIKIRVTNTSGLIVWAMTTKDIAQIKMLTSEYNFGEVIDVSDIGRIEKDIKDMLDQTN